MNTPRVRPGRKDASANVAPEVAAERKNLPAASRQIIAHARNDITIPYYSTTLRPQDDTIIQRGGGKGIGLYREVLRDGRAYTVFQKRRRALIARSWTVTPASEAEVDKRAAAIVESQLQALSFDRVALDLLGAQLMGFATSETIWDRDGNEIVARQIRTIKQERIVFDLDWEPRLLTLESMLDGIKLPPRKFIVHRFEDDGSDPYGRGLGSIIFWHVLFKREGVAFWLKALERFAVPLPVAKYPFGSLPGEQQKLLDALSSAVVSGALVVPSGTEIDFAKGMISGNMRQEDWCRYWDEQTAETILGETLTTNLNGNGSRAAAEVHKGVKDELIDGDADELAGTLNGSLVEWITAYNVPDAAPPTLAWERPQNLVAEETAKKAKADRQKQELENFFMLKAEGFEPDKPEETLSEIMDFKVKASAAGPERKPDLRGSTALTPPAAAFAGPSDAYHDIVADLDKEALAARQVWLDVIRQEIARLIERGGDLGDLPQVLLDLYPALETERLSSLIGDAMMLAELRGMADATDETT